MSSVPYRGRFAPSPTGDFHLGSAATALIAWIRARRAGGRFIWRVEDLDRPRVVAGSEQRQLDELRWLGLDWDEGPDVGGTHAPYRQSERVPFYEEALARLKSQGHLYLCDCSRAEIAESASAPHLGEDGPRYPGTCRSLGLADRRWKRPPAIRLMVPDREIEIQDRIQGTFKQNVYDTVGDFVLARGDGIYTYQLAVVVDDLTMKVSEVVRGADLLSSAPRQALLAEMLGYVPPHFAHAPLILDGEGKRLQKREPRHTLRGPREMGQAPEMILARLAKALGLLAVAEPDRISIRELLARADLAALHGRREIRYADEDSGPRTSSSRSCQ